MKLSLNLKCQHYRILENPAATIYVYLNVPKVLSCPYKLPYSFCLDDEYAVVCLLRYDRYMYKYDRMKGDELSAGDGRRLLFACFPRSSIQFPTRRSTVISV